jgi:hypothetical protein
MSKELAPPISTSVKISLTDPLFNMLETLIKPPDLREQHGHTLSIDGFVLWRLLARELSMAGFAQLSATCRVA